MTKDDEIFKGISFSDIMSAIYSNQKKKDRQIKLLIAQLEPMVKNLNDASVVVPLIKEYLEISVKNDDALVKLAAIVQRMMKDNNTGDGNYMLSDEEKRQLMDAIEEVEKEIICRAQKDTNRKISPLRKSSDAVEISTDGLSIGEVTQKIVDIFKTTCYGKSSVNNII